MGVCLFGFCNRQVINAATTIAVSPTVFELTGNPGEVIENQVKISNPSDSQVGIKMAVEDIAPTGEAGYVIPEPAETETYSLANWIKCTPNEFVLEPGQSQWVSFSITIPNNAEPGGHYGTVLAASASIAGSNITGTALVTRIGTLVLLTTPGKMKEFLAVKDFYVSSTIPYFEYGPVYFNAKFENLGNVHVRPLAMVTVTNWLGQKVGVATIKQQNVLPRAVRKFDAVLDKKWFWAGKYTATITGTYGSENSLVPVVITFWAFPWKFGLIILASIIILILMRNRLISAIKILVRGERY
ncbi:MAG: DUF916 domain-containing protein [Candidatus Pacebacteria bacterium]|nr:DUF916 domain-containing protein [Candidatus Paceibacterota bacterium]